MQRARLFTRQCIFCRTDKWTKDAQTTARCREALCQVLTDQVAERIKQLSKTEGYENLLLIVEGEDLIAREAMYHRTCYLSATYDYTKKIDKQSCYQRFTEEVIEKRIIKNGEILPMNKVTELYKSITADSSGESVLISNWNLKRKMKSSHPQLKYIKASDILSCELVRCVDCSKLTLKDGLSFSDEQSTADDDDDNEGGDMQSSSHNDDEFTTNRHIYHCAMMISLILKVIQSVTQWPPLASDLSVDALWNIVPYQLYNLLAWMTGLCDEFSPDPNYVSVERHTDKLKLLSICQDVIYLASGGRKCTPKHICLGLTLRHLTGSQTVVDIVSGLGHCVSSSSAVDYDSALAQYRGEADGIVPFGFESIFTSLVVDNNDFKEQTLSGKGTTHCTTGLAMQRKLNSPSVEPTRQSLPKENHGPRR